MPALMRLLIAAGMSLGLPSVLPRLFVGELQVRSLAEAARALPQEQVPAHAQHSAVALVRRAG
jgi:hypothetical protein